jgi:hypothetical protein
MAAGALPLGHDPLIAEAKRRALRRKVAGVVVIILVGSAVGVILALRPTGGSGTGARTYHVDGIRVRVPAGWYFTRRHLTYVTGPVQRLVVSSVPVPPVAPGTFVPPQSGVLAQILEESPPAPGGAWKPRPATLRFGRLGGMETYGGHRWDEFLFSLAGRHFYAFAWVGPTASASERRQLLSILEQMQVSR